MSRSEPTPFARRRIRLVPVLFATLVVAGAATSLPPATPGETDGAVGKGVRISDVIPAVANLDPHLRRVLRDAASAAARDGIEIVVNSGWRSRQYQQQLFRQAIDKYGSEREASRWVATENASSHVSGDAVDIGPARAAAWLARHGAAYQLCRVYRNEPWHYELRPGAVDNRCPTMYADARHDPRMQP